MATSAVPKEAQKEITDIFELQARMLFAVIVAGKSAKFASKALAEFLKNLEGDEKPFQMIRRLDRDGLLDHYIRTARLGNYRKMYYSFIQLATYGLNLRTCTPEQLETVYGIGPKTSRFFIIWTRPNARYAALDVHVLRWMRAKGYNAPHVTPTKKRYADLEAAFIAEADAMGLTPRELDSKIWEEATKLDFEYEGSIMTTQEIVSLIVIPGFVGYMTGMIAAPYTEGMTFKQRLPYACLAGILGLLAHHAFDFFTLNK